MQNLTTASIGLCLLIILGTETTAASKDTDAATAQVAGRAGHAALACTACHRDDGSTPATATVTKTCESCHQDSMQIFNQSMTTRVAERAFVHQTFGTVDPDFFNKNCMSCHVNSCASCHGSDAHQPIRPTSAQCNTCHRGYFVGADYLGQAPREDHRRYQRNQDQYGEAYLTMLPDVHVKAGLDCADCHSMASLAQGKRASKTCTDCHEPDLTILEHSIPEHMAKLECYACHSAWGTQEYGTFFLRFRESTLQKHFTVKETGHAEYRKSGYLKQQNSPPLGLNERGKISPIRPQFITYFSDFVKDKPVGQENQLLAARWKPFFPHTIARGSVLCEECHHNPRRFLLEDPKDRIYQLKKDNMQLNSFWDRSGQTIDNGSFLAPDRVQSLSADSPRYRKAVIEKWQQLLHRVDDSSQP